LQIRDLRDEDVIDPRIFEIYNAYCHGHISRREFLSRAAVISVAGVSGLAMAQALMPRYLEAQTISFTDPRYEMEMFEGTLHGFHHNSTPRFNEVAAALAWNRTIGFFRTHLGA
jgi:hypothetical protein